MNFLSIAVFAMASWMFLAWPTKAYDSDVYFKLKSSRDALLSQRKEVERAQAEVDDKLQTLEKKQALLDSYVRQLDKSIRDVEDAMRNVH